MRVPVTLVTLILVIALSTPAQAAGQNFVEQFLSRYRPSPVALPPSPSERSQQALGDLIRSGALPLTVGDVINLMIQNNLDIGVNRLSPLSTSFLIESFYRPFEPTLHFQASLGRDTTPSTSQLTGAPSLSVLSQGYTVGFGETLPTGTNVGVDFTMNRSSSNSAFNTFNPAWRGNVRYSINQHLLRDRGRINNTRQIRVAQNNRSISEVQFERQLIDLVAQGQRLYWDLVFTAEDIKVKQRSMELAQKTLSDNQIQVQIGTLAPIDVVQAESEVATRREQLIVSTFTQSQMEDQVKKLISPQGDPGMVLARLSPTESAKLPGATALPIVEQAIRVALENRPEMRQLDMEIQNKESDVQSMQNQLLPTVDVFANYNQTGVGGRETLRNGFGGTAPIISVHEGGLGDAFGQLFGYNYTGYAIGFSVQIPLRNRAAQGEHARATTEKRIVENRKSAQAQQIALEVRNALTILEMNRARIEAAQKARELAERRLDAEQKKFDLGASTIRFVLEEQRNVTQSQTNEIASLVNYTKALVDLDRAMGMILRNNNIEIEKTLALPATAR